MLTNANTMTVGELRAMLAGYTDDMPVLLQAPSGDYWKTNLAMPVSDGEELLVEWSDYHGTYTVPEQDDDESSEWAVVLGGRI